MNIPDIAQRLAAKAFNFANTILVQGTYYRVTEGSYDPSTGLVSPIVTTGPVDMVINPNKTTEGPTARQMVATIRVQGVQMPFEPTADDYIIETETGWRWDISSYDLDPAGAVWVLEATKRAEEAFRFPQAELWFTNSSGTSPINPADGDGITQWTNLGTYYQPADHLLPGDDLNVPTWGHLGTKPCIQFRNGTLFCGGGVGFGGHYTEAFTMAVRIQLYSGQAGIIWGRTEEKLSGLDYDVSWLFRHNGNSTMTAEWQINGTKYTHAFGGVPTGQITSILVLFDPASKIRVRVNGVELTAFPLTVTGHLDTLPDESDAEPTIGGRYDQVLGHSVDFGKFDAFGMMTWPGLLSDSQVAEVESYLGTL